jgi:hypothetical protein
MMMLIWIGHRRGVEMLPGVPARNLTPDEARQYGGERFLLSTGLWEKAAAHDERD